MAVLAIQGHATRGKEVIEILKMLGGRNPYDYHGDCDSLCFYISKGTNEIHYDCVNNCYEDEDVFVFTLEEFIEKFPYKVMDKVSAFGNKWTIIDAVWDGSIYEVVYTITSETSDYTTTKLSNQLQPYEEETFGECIEKAIDECLFGKEEPLLATPTGKEGCYSITKEQYDSVNIEITGEKEAKIVFDKHVTAENVELVLGKDYEVIQKDGKWFVVKKQPKYPKTYAKCCVELGIGNKGLLYTEYNEDLLQSFQKLIICRDAYWKIAGEEMGLVEPWEPNWYYNQFKYIILCRINNIIKDTVTSKNSILAFPTEKMRDAFYENFKDLIERCKKLL